MTSSHTPSSPSPVIPTQFLLSFCLVTSLFALWGFANDITNPMVAAFGNVLLMSNFESSLVQFAFYGGYCVMAIPAAIFIKRFTYKSGILVGLSLYVIGCFLFLPAGMMMAFWAFLAAYFIMTCGLSFLETSSNPYILAMGDESTATRRLNFAQSFNPMGSLIGMFVARTFILARLDETPEAGRRALSENDPSSFEKIVQNDLWVIVTPYLILGAVVLCVLFVFAVTKLPKTQGEDDKELRIGATLKNLFSLPRYWTGVIAQAFYVGVQIMVWTFIIQYAVNELSMPAKEAQTYNIAAMVIFVSSRFICTFLLKFISPGRLLAMLSAGGLVLTLGAIFIQGMAGLYCLVGISACMSLMFPTIYGIALDGLGDDAKLGAAGLILAIGGGCLMPPIQGWLMDQDAITIGSYALSSTRYSFFLPALCFVVVGLYGVLTFKVFHPPSED